MGEEKDHKPEIIMHCNAPNSGVDILDKLVREYICTRSTRHWPLKLFHNLIDVACVNAFGNKRRKIEDACICFVWEKKW